MKKVLVTSTSFQDTPGEHQIYLNSQGFEVHYLRGPLKAEVLLPIIGDFDGIICGDDDVNREVIEKCKQGNIKVISKYGIGLDKIDLVAANEFGIPVTNCPGVNQITVAEHVFAMVLSYFKNIIHENSIIQNGEWVRLIGRDIYGKTIGIIGLGAVGKEVAKRAIAFGMKVVAFDKIIDEEFGRQFGIDYLKSVEELMANSDVISLNASLNHDSTGLINHNNMAQLKSGVVIVNTARAGLIDQDVVLNGIEKGIIAGYLTDVLEVEPMVPNHPFLGNVKIVITPHIGSRTYENVERQGKMSVENLLKYI